MKPPTKRTAIIALSIGIVGYALLRSVPLLIDTSDIKRQIEEGLHKSTGVNFKIQELTLEPTIFHGIQAHLNTTAISDMQHHKLGSVENITVQIRYLPLLTRQTPEIAKIHLNHVRVPVGEYSLFTSVKLKLVKPEKTGFLNPAELKDAEILLTDYLIEDTIPADSTRQVLPKVKRFRIEGKEVSVRHLESNKPISVLGNGELAYLQAKPAKGEAIRQPMGPYRLFVEVPQSVTEEGKTFSAEDLSRLELKVDGKAVNFALDYLHKKNQPAEGGIKSAGLDALQSQALAFQLADTIGLPIPSEYSPYWASGKTRLDTRFKLSFKNGQPVFEEANGSVNLDNMAVYTAKDLKTPLVSRINGKVLLKGKVIDVQRLQAWAQGLPFNAQGTYNLANERINGVVYGHNLNVDSLRKSALAMGAPPDAFQGRNIGGLLNIDAKITGTSKNPSYQGLIAIRDGSFSDAAEGIFANHVSGKASFRGSGLKNPLIDYNGLLNVDEGKLIIASQGVNVNKFDGQVRFKGQVRPNDKTVAMPNLDGAINVRDADYKDPKSGVPVTGIHGVLRLAGDLIHIDNFRALLAGSELQANGQLSTNLKDYRVRVTGNQIDLPRLKREVLMKLPDFQPLAAQIDPYSGQANLDLTVSTGMNLAGRLDVDTLALRTAETEESIRIPRLSVLLNGQNIHLTDTRIYYGPIAALVSGDFTTSGGYNVRLDTGDVPVSFVRDNQDMLAAFAGAELPEIWNAAGSFRAKGTASNRLTDMALSFNDAGLSWAGGDFPVYDLNGDVIYRQSGQEAPLMSSRNLTMRYGNSPVQVNIEQRSGMKGEIRGMLSALAVNHFLVSPQSNATPYQEVPFRINLNGMLGGLPGQPQASRNNLIADVFLGLNRNFRQAYSDVPAEASTGSAEKQVIDLPSLEMETAAPDINRLDRKPLRNINAINAANTALGAVSNTTDIVKGTLGKGLETLIRPGQFIAQKIRERPHESVDTTATQTQELPGQIQAGQLAEDQGNAFLRATLHLLPDSMLLEKANLQLFDGGNVLADGRVDNLSQPDKLIFRSHVMTVPEINMAAVSRGALKNQFFSGADGTIGADIQLLGDHTGLQSMTGWLATNRLAVPYLTLQDVTARIDLQGRTATAEVPSFKVPGVTARVSAITDDILASPITLENVKIDGSFVSIASLADFNNDVIKPKIVDQIVHNYLKPWQQGDPTSPVQFRNADLHADEVIYENIILSNLNSKFSVNSNSFFELTNTSLQAAGGQVTGYLSMSPNQRSFTTLELNAAGVKANALTKALLGVTNQIFGDLSGTVRFTTFGESDVDMQKNANGTVTMKITNGRLPAIAKVETLLATANVFRGGILGLNLNNIFRSLTIYDNKYFAELSGDMLINNQILYTQNLVSDGVNLDLLIQGSLRMDNGNANMLVNGRMSQEIVGKLGKLGNLSLGKLFHFIPALGNLGENQPGLLGYIPGVGYVPGFGGPAGKYNRFQVRIVGQPDDPAAIQDFQWVRPKNL